MTRHAEILTVEDVADQPRATVRHHRNQPCRGKQTSRLFPESESNNGKEESKPRFRIDSPAPAVKRDAAKSPMRVLLRNARTMKFFRSGERWTKDPKKARNFHNGWWATVHAFTMNPRHLVIHYEFDDERYNLHIPVLGRPQI